MLSTRSSGKRIATGRYNLADGSFWVYEYDSLGQVKSGKRHWSDWTPVAGQQFEYGFDDIGNRTSTKAGGDSSGGNLRSASYTANNLNQITQRDVPAYLNVIGAASATATNVNVNNVMAYRRGEYYRVELNPDNSSAVWQSVTNRAVQNGTTNSVTGNLFLPKHAEAFSYDADGNLTNDGRWAYVWDGENRLRSLTSRPSSPAGSSNALHFAYDWRGRRVSKTVSNYSGSAWSKVLDEKYLYDAWNLLSSLNASNSAVVLAFLWGGMQSAGGVGELLAVKANGVSVTFAAYDGNGNITALINAAGGDALANYEYGPFGEVIRCSGGAAKTNPFRFSTKFQDDETDFHYYGYRYYDPSNGRWLSRDPIEEEGGDNLYAFVENDSVDNSDVLGLYPAEVRSIHYSDHGSAEPDGRTDTHYVVIDDLIYGQVPMNVSHSKLAAGITAHLDDSFSTSIMAWTQLGNVPAGKSLNMSTDLNGTITVCCSCPATEVHANFSLSASISRIGAANANFEDAAAFARSRNRTDKQTGSRTKQLNSSYCTTFKFDLGQKWIDQLRTGSTLSQVRISVQFDCTD